MPIRLQDVGLAVKRLQWRHHRDMNTRLAELDLSLAQWDVLRHLDHNPDASLHDLAVLTFQTDQSMGSLAVRMSAKGLLERVDGPGRAVRHIVTATGRRAFAQGSTLVDSVFEDTIGRLTPEERDELFRLLTTAIG